MDTARITEILTDPVTLDLVERQPIMQIAYTAADGSPRAVPIGYLLREGKFLFFTIPSSDKVAALHHDPRIALTIDVYPPPCCLLVRGTAELHETGGEAINPRFPNFAPQFFRIRPTRIVAWGIDEQAMDAKGFQMNARSVR